ncbi:CheB methylesterase domain-containing protein [Geomesophilobacter sediminis]|uniref:protein-glutamate methylesterase n=1 Tax=Geomesophilobacter sediminis TaxID=2798584 RepID=A0A8J7LXZ3_9BACT|nr:CheB methylesterase domain-containing protein [Geomesophilobacter sediminis]MBJ6723976.1 chemotaxis protein CheB [Geomesophilobacter sediminis]
MTDYPIPSRRPGAPAVPSILAIGASTGGPKAVMSILKALPDSFGGAIIVVQHIADGCDLGFAQWLDRECRIPVRLAEDGAALRRGEVLVAPNGYHLRLDFGVVRLEPGAPVNCCRPSIDVFLESLAEEPCRHVVGVLLTGMGKDGARGMAALREKGGVTIVQDQQSCAIFGMPKAAIQLGAAQQVLPLPEIPGTLLRLFPNAPPA